MCENGRRSNTRLRKALILLSHKLASEQEKELREVWQVDQIVYLPEKLQVLWSNVPPEEGSVEKHIYPILEWIKENSNPGDIVVIQGDFGSTYIAVNKAFGFGLIPVYATTRRSVREVQNPDGSVKQERIFKHVRFRIYEGKLWQRCSCQFLEPINMSRPNT